ncbi:MAG: protein phosphatase 2C domain-containing protein [Parachlamydiales bacterium]|nr:protein phosphatase 2C domain-containing protein [Parachlamydiales bacterium]
MSSLTIHQNPAWTETASIRIFSIPKALSRLAEAVGRAVLSLIACIGYFATFGVWKKALEFAIDQREMAGHALHVSYKHIQSLIYPFRPLNLNPNLIEPPAGRLNAEVRENRVRVGAERIQGKLEREWTMAQEQMGAEEDGAFRYIEGNFGHKETDRVGGLDVGICHYIGRRPEMEDEHIATSFHVMINGQVHSGKLFGIFDGHGGRGASRYLRDHLQAKLQEKLEQFNSAGLTDEEIWNALKLSFVELNNEFNEQSGSTATVAMILDGQLWTANVGDSRTILQNGDEIQQLSQDANLDDERYVHGIRARGGEVWPVRGVLRVNGILAVARGFGDKFTNGAMSARPKITKLPLDRIQPNSRLILACDGIYDVASTRQVGNAARQNISCEKLAQNIVSSAYAAGSGDNLSAMVVNLG